MKPPVTVDVDNPHYRDDVDPISAHDRIADLYGHRAPYTDRFFAVAADKLGLSAEKTVVDLCCGRGELASGFAGFAGAVHAVDGSQAMLNRRIERPNIVYALGDVNDPALKLPDHVDAVTVGRAIHWISGEALARLTRRTNATFLITFSTFRHESPAFRAALRALNAGFGKQDIRIDLTGNEKFRAVGYSEIDYFSVARHVGVTLDRFCGNQLSYLYRGFYDYTVGRQDIYRRELHARLGPFAVDGRLQMTLLAKTYLYAPA